MIWKPSADVNEWLMQEMREIEASNLNSTGKLTMHMAATFEAQRRAGIGYDSIKATIIGSEAMQSTLAPDENIRWLSRQEAAAWLNMPESFIARAIKDGRLHIVKYGKHERVRANDVDRLTPALSAKPPRVKRPL